MDEKEKARIMEERAKEFFKNFDSSETYLADEILTNLETMLGDTHPITIEKLHIAIMELIVEHTDYVE